MINEGRRGRNKNCSKTLEKHPSRADCLACRTFKGAVFLSKVTPEFAKWLLWNQEKLRASMEPGAPVSTFKAVVTMQDGGSQVERIAVKREAIVSVLSALDRAYNAMHPEHKRLYRYRFRDGMSYNQITRKMEISPDSIGRRITEITDIVAAFLESVPEHEHREFSRFVSNNL